MARFINKKDGRIAELLSTNEKFKTVRVNICESDGTTTETEFSLSTWKRWWKKKTEETFEYEETANDISNAIAADFEAQEAAEEVAGDGTSYKQVMDEILQDEKKAVADKKAKKVQEPKKAKKEKKPVFDSTALQEYAIQVVQELGGDYKQRMQNNGAKDMAQKVFRAGGKMFMHMSYPRYYLRMDTRGVDMEELVPTKELTGFYSARYEFTEDTKQVRSKIKKILTQAYKAQLAKNNSKKGKGEK